MRHYVIGFHLHSSPHLNFLDVCPESMLVHHRMAVSGDCDENNMYLEISRGIYTCQSFAGEVSLLNEIDLVDGIGIRFVVVDDKYLFRWMGEDAFYRQER